MTDIIVQHRQSISSPHQTHLLSPAFPLEPKKRNPSSSEISVSTVPFQSSLKSERRSSKFYFLSDSDISIHSIDQVIQPGVMPLLKRFVYFLTSQHNN